MNTQPPSDAALERRLRAHLRDRYGEPPATDALWARLAPRLDPRDAADTAADADYQISPALREIALEDIVGSETETERRTHTVRSTRMDTTRPRGFSRPLALLAPVAAVLVLAALGGALLVAQGLNRPSRPPTTIQRGQLIWQRAGLPEGRIFGSRGVAFMVAPSDGNTVYVCIAAQVGAVEHPQLWVTHDRALHWARLTDVPTTRNATGCDFGVDQLDSRIVTVTTYLAGADGGALAPPAQWERFVSFDGGKTWSARATGGSTFLLGGHFHATWQSKTYAALYLLPLAEHPVARLFVSDDQMRSWTAIDAPIIASAAVRTLPPDQRNVWNVQVHPSTGELLATVAGWQLWESPDGGAHWTQLVVPVPTPSDQSSRQGGGKSIYTVHRAADCWAALANMREVERIRNAGQRSHLVCLHGGWRKDVDKSARPILRRIIPGWVTAPWCWIGIRRSGGWDGISRR